MRSFSQDMILTLDYSGSMGINNWDLQAQFSLLLVRAAKESFAKTRFGLVRFGLLQGEGNHSCSEYIFPDDGSVCRHGQPKCLIQTLTPEVLRSWRFL